MKVELTLEEAALIQFAIVSTDELWKPSREVKGADEPKDELVQKVLDKVTKILEGGSKNEMSKVRV